MIIDATYDELGQPSNKLRNVYVFQPKAVKKGDYVYLWTGIGKDITFEKEGTTRHRIYWGLKKAVWNDAGDKGTLFKVSQINSVKAA